MRYKTLKIEPSIDGSSWELTIHSDYADRIEQETKPNPLGTYCFPETMHITEAIKHLKHVMIARHMLEIERLTVSLESLRQV